MGSSFAIGKRELQYVSPLLLVGIRFTLAGLLMAIAVIHREHPRHLTTWMKIAIIGLFQTTGVMGCIFINLCTITASESSILFLAPFFGVIFGWILLDERVTWEVLVGGILILFGIFFVNWPKPQPRS